MISGLKLGTPSYETAAVAFGAACESIYKSGTFVLGEFTDRMEKVIGEELGGTAIAFSSCTDATQAVLFASDCKYLLVPTMAFPSTIIAADRADCEVELFDVDCERMEYPLTHIEDRLRSLKANNIVNGNIGVLLSHFGGGSWMQCHHLAHICDTHGVELIEDISHSWGATVYDRKVGTFGDFVVGSLFATKQLHSGTGAFFVDRTPDTLLDSRMRRLREYGRSHSHGTNFIKYPGGSWRISEMEAALFLLNESDAVEEAEARRGVLERYGNELSMYEWPDEIVPNGYRAFYRTEWPEEMADALKDRGIGLVGKVFDCPVQDVPYVADQHLSIYDFGQALKWCNSHICLPCYSRMTDREVEQVIKEVKNAESIIWRGRSQTSPLSSDDNNDEMVRSVLRASVGVDSPSIV